VVALRTQKNQLERLGGAPNQTNDVPPRGMEAKNSAPRRQIRQAIHEVDLSEEDPSHLTATTTSSARTPNDSHPSKANKYDPPPTHMQHPQTKDRPEYRACQPRAVRADEDLCPSFHNYWTRKEYASRGRAEPHIRRWGGVFDDQGWAGWINHSFLHHKQRISCLPTKITEQMRTCAPPSTNNGHDQPVVSNRKTKME
jgi:hypothetical protein